MPFSVVMPALEMAQETGKVIAWLKKEGDRVAKGEPLLEIETDKAVVEIEAPAEGVLAGIQASEGTEIPVGQTIAWIVAPGEQPPTNGATSVAPVGRAGVHSRTEESIPADAKRARATTKISPKARRLAKELSVDLAAIKGSGADGEILASDIQAAHVKTAALAAPQESVRSATARQLVTPTTVGRIMAERTTQSWTTIPHFFISRELDASGLNEYRSRISAHGGGVRVTHTDVLVALVSRVLIKHPRVNASWTSAGIRLHDYVNMGVGIAVEDGVVAAVISNAHRSSLVQIARQRVELSERAKTGKLRPTDIADATFTISNLGMYKVEQFNAIITPPQAAILAVGAITERVVAVDTKPAVRPMMTLTLSCDHRLVDGARAATFLVDVADAIAEPSKLLD
jgi:pyruvate dehydrogenase E2 component (dihydrolipoamide acetyltransferase)